MNHDILFKKSFNLIKNNKELGIPFFLSSLSLYIILTIFILTSGLYAPIQNYVETSQEYNELVAGQINNYKNLASAESITLADEVQEKEDKLVEKFTNPTLYISLMIHIIVWYLISSFFVNVGFYQNSKIISEIGYKPNFIESLSKSFKYYFKYIGLNLTFFAILLLPLLLLGLITYIFSIINTAIFVILIIIDIVFFIFWLIVVPLRLIYFVPSIYLGPKNSESKISYAFRITKGKLETVFMVSLIIYGSSVLVNYFSNQPLNSIFQNLLFSQNIFTILILILLFGVFLLFLGILNCFVNLYYFNSFIEFKEKNS